MTNNEIKNLSKLSQKKFRDIGRKFLIEGKHLIEECIKSELYKRQIEEIFYTDTFKDEIYLKNLERLKYPTKYLDMKAFKKMSETKSPQGILAVINKPLIKNSIHTPNIILALENVNDPGNLGTIIRTAWWFGIEKILLSKNSADIYNSKCIRATQGGIFNVEVDEDLDLLDSLNSMEKSGYKIILMRLDSNKSLYDFKPNKNSKYIFVFGNEANGITDELKNHPRFDALMIPSYTKCESLNLASSVSILCYHFMFSLEH